MNRSIFFTCAYLLVISAPGYAQKDAAVTKTPNPYSARAPRDLFAAQTGPQQITLSWFAPVAPDPRRNEAIVICSVGEQISRRSVSTPIARTKTDAGNLITYVMPTSGEVPHRCHIEVGDRSSVVRYPFNEVTPVSAVAPAPPTPDTITAMAYGPNTFILTWTPGANTTAYRIDRRGIRGNTVLCYLCPPTGSYVDSTVIRGERQVTYAIAAIGPGGMSRQRHVEVDPARAATAGGGGKLPGRAPAPPSIMNVNATTPAMAAQVVRVTLHEDARTVTQILRLAPGAEIAEHHHPNHNETIFVHSGTVEVTLEGKSRKFVTGDLAFVPAGTTMRARNADTQEAQIIVVFSNIGTPGPLTVPGPHR